MFCSLDIIKALQDTPKGTREVSKKIGCCYATAWERLRKLHDEGKIEGRKLRPCQAGAWVWYLKKEDK